MIEIKPTIQIACHTKRKYSDQNYEITERVTTKGQCKLQKNASSDTRYRTPEREKKNHMFGVSSWASSVRAPPDSIKLLQNRSPWFNGTFDESCDTALNHGAQTDITPITRCESISHQTLCDKKTAIVVTPPIQRHSRVNNELVSRKTINFNPFISYDESMQRRTLVEPPILFRLRRCEQG